MGQGRRVRKGPFVYPCIASVGKAGGNADHDASGLAHLLLVTQAAGERARGGCLTQDGAHGSVQVVQKERQCWGHIVAKSCRAALHLAQVMVLA